MKQRNELDRLVVNIIESSVVLFGFLFAIKMLVDMFKS